MASPTILFVGEDSSLIQNLSDQFRADGFETHVAESGTNGLLEAQTTRPDVVLLDLPLGGAGFETCRALRTDPLTKETLIVLLGASAEESDQIVGYSLGADDYVVKPFSHRVMLARIRSLLRRGKKSPWEGIAYQAGGLRVDRVRHRVSFHGKRVDCTTTEFRILELLIRQAGRALRREEILRLTLGQETQVRTIDAFIKSIRQKLTLAGAANDLIETVRGVGYRLGNG